MTAQATSDSEFFGEEGLDYTSLDRYWLGEASPQEVLAVEVWFAKNPEQGAWYHSLRTSIQAGHWTPLPSAAVEKTIARVFCDTGLSAEADQTPVRGAAAPVYQTANQRTHPQTAYTKPGSSHLHLPPSVQSRVGSSSRRWIRWGGPAAVLSVLLILMGWYTGVHRLSQSIAAQTWTYATSNGERARVTLPDGSIVDLNVASRLDVSADYATNTRTVTLMGEALFTVVPHHTKPFIVVAGSSRTQVLGTRFIVRRYASDTVATIAVRDGKVAVNSVVVSATQQIMIGDSYISPITKAADEQFRFADGVLAFNSVPLESAITALNRWYDADIRLGDVSLAQQRVTGECAKGSITDLVELLEGTFQVRVVRNLRTLILYPR